jgi:hypothetical protein
MVCRVRLSSFYGTSLLTPAQATGTTTAPAAFPTNGTLPDGTSATGYYYNIVDAFGNVIVAGGQEGNPQIPYQNFVRYCEFPGNRLFQLVKFDVNGNPLDQYDTMIPTMLEKFCTPPNKRVGHDRLVGQEVPRQGYGGLCQATVVDADAADTPAGISIAQTGQSNQTVGLFAANAAAIGSDTVVGSTVLNQTVIVPLNSQLANPTPALQGQYDVSRQLLQIVNGPQTPKPVQAPLEIWNKLRFWFNDDVRLSIASVSIPFGQRFISIDLAQQNYLAFDFPSIYLQTITDGTTAGAGTPGGPTTLRKITYSPIYQTTSTPTTEISIEKMELYINNIFVNPEVHDIYIKRIGFSLIRVYRQHNQRCNQESADEKLLSQLKWPVEYMMVGLRPVWNIKSVNQNQWRDWHRMTYNVQAYCDDPSLAQAASATSGGAQVAATGSSIGEVMPDTYYLPVPTVDSLTLTSHGIVIFDNFQDTFFNQYMPFHYGGPALVTPDDVGALFVNMALFPRSYQPSGHLNISRARETYLKWTTSYVSASTPADLLAVAVAINFLLITDGSAVLRYST